MRKQFDIKYRPQIESGEYKVETKSGRPIRVLAWDLPCDFPIATAEFTEDNRVIVESYSVDGWVGYGEKENNLVIVTPDTCGHCVRFRPSDGYCHKTGRYVNALAPAKCFIAEEPAPVESPKKAVRIRRQSASSIAFRTEKTCPSCGRTLPLDEFVKCKRNPDGHDCYCKQCMAEKTRKYAQKKKRANN